MPTFKLVDEHGVWLENIRLSVPDWKAGHRIQGGPGDTLEIIDVRTPEGLPILVVRSGRVPNSD